MSASQVTKFNLMEPALNPPNPLRKQYLLAPSLLPGKPRFSSSPDSVKVSGGYADCTHPSAYGFSVINHRCVLLTGGTHPFIFNALKACMGKTEAIMIVTLRIENGVDWYPNLPSEDDLAWFENHWTEDTDRLRERTCSGRVWKNIKTDDGEVCVISFWSILNDVPDSVLHLILEALNLPGERPVYVEFEDTTEPILISRLNVPVLELFSFQAVVDQPMKAVIFPDYKPRQELWPHGQLFTDIIGAKQMPLSTVAERMGFEKIKSGINAVSAFVYGTESPPPEFLSKMATALEIDPAELDSAMSRTQEEVQQEEVRYRQWQEDRDRALFVPHLRIHYERISSSPSYPVRSSQALYISLPEDINQWPWEQQLKTVGLILRDRSSPPFIRTWPLSRVASYTYRQTFDVAFEFDTDGNPKGQRVCLPPFFSKPYSTT